MKIIMVVIMQHSEMSLWNCHQHILLFAFVYHTFPLDKLVLRNIYTLYTLGVFHC